MPGDIGWIRKNQRTRFGSSWAMAAGAEVRNCLCSVIATTDLQQNLPVVPRSVPLVTETTERVKGDKTTSFLAPSVLVEKHPCPRVPIQSMQCRDLP